MDERADGFPAFVADHEQQLLGTALLLTGDPAAADELVVAALARTHRRWHRLGSADAALADTRDVLVAAALGRARLPATGADSAIATAPDADDDDHDHDEDRRWLQALAGLDRRTRVITVLRLHDGRDEDAVAALLDCSPTDVADALADGLSILGRLLAAEPDPDPAPPAADGAGWSAGAPVPPPVDDAPAPAGDGDAYAIYRPAGVPAARPGPDGDPAQDGDAIYRPGAAAAASPRVSRAVPPGSAPARGPAEDGDPYAIYRPVGAPPGPPGPDRVLADDGDPDAVYRRPGAPQPRRPLPATREAAPATRGTARRPLPATREPDRDDPEAAYRRPT